MVRCLTRRPGGPSASPRVAMRPPRVAMRASPPPAAMRRGIMRPVSPPRVAMRASPSR